MMSIHCSPFVREKYFFVTDEGRGRGRRANICIIEALPSSIFFYSCLDDEETSPSSVAAFLHQRMCVYVGCAYTVYEKWKKEEGEGSLLFGYTPHALALLPSPTVAAEGLKASYSSSFFRRPHPANPFSPIPNDHLGGAGEEGLGRWRGKKEKEKGKG